MDGNRSQYFLIFITILIVITVSVVTFSLLYQEAVKDQHQRLVDTVKIKTALIQSVAEFDSRYSVDDHPEGSAAATLSQIIAAHQKSGHQIGRTGEWLVAKLEGEQIHFLVPFRHSTSMGTKVGHEMGGSSAVPMQRALNGETGFMFGRDYRGVEVMSAFVPVPQLGIGIVAKIDMGEVRAPFIWIAGIVFVLAVVLSAGGAFIFRGWTGRFIARLRNSEVRLAEAQRIAQIGSWELDLLTGELKWSDEIFRIFEIDQNKFAASYEAFLEGIHPDDRDMVNNAYNNSVATRTPYDIVHRLQMKDGEIKYVREHCESFYSHDGTAIRSVGTVQDVTQLQLAEERLREAYDDLEGKVVARTTELERAMEAAEASSRLKSEFLSRISHELRTPMNAIIGFGQLLEAEDISDNQKLMLSEITFAGNHLLDLINELLDLSQIESGNIEINAEDVILHNEIQSCLDMVRSQAMTRNIRLMNNIEEGDALIIHVDVGRFHEVIINLLSNAIKYSDEGDLIEVSCKMVSAKRVRIMVRDNGPGIAADKHILLFEPFQRLGMEYTDIEGTGFGLAIARRLIKLMGGEIGVESKEGEGATFWIECPGFVKDNVQKGASIV